MPFDGNDFAPAGYLQKIDRVVDLIGTPGKWGKGSFRTHDGRYCLRGAIREVDGSEAIAPVVLAAINEVMGRHYWRIESFNDHPQTDHEQVLAVLLCARENIAAGKLPQSGPQGSMLSRWWRDMTGWCWR